MTLIRGSDSKQRFYRKSLPLFCCASAQSFCGIMYVCIREIQLERLWNHEKMFETEVVRGIEC